MYYIAQWNPKRVDCITKKGLQVNTEIMDEKKKKKNSKSKFGVS